MPQSTSKPPLIFIHGFRGSPLGLQPIIDVISQEYKDFEPSIPPFAQAQPLAEYTPDTYADFIADFIKQNHLKHPILLGHSMGSIITAAVAQKYPDLINRKIFFLSPMISKPNKFISSLQPLVAYSPNSLVSLITTSYLFVPKDWQLFKHSLQLTKQCALKYTSKRDVSLATKFSTKYCIQDFHLPKDKELIFIAGTNDRLVKQPITKHFAKQTHGKLKLIPNTGHLVNYENPVALSQAIQECL